MVGKVMLFLNGTDQYWRCYHLLMGSCILKIDSPAITSCFYVIVLGLLVISLISLL